MKKRTHALGKEERMRESERQSKRGASGVYWEFGNWQTIVSSVACLLHYQWSNHAYHTDMR